MTDSVEATTAAAATAAIQGASGSAERTPGPAGQGIATTTAVGSGENIFCDSKGQVDDTNSLAGRVLPNGEDRSVAHETSNGGDDRSMESGIGGAGASSDAADTNKTMKTRPPRVGSVRQLRKEKRKAAWDAKKAKIKEKRRAEREKREEAMRKEGLEIPVNGIDYRELPREQWSVSQKINHRKRQEFETLLNEGSYRVCIDMSFDELMVAKAQASLVQQVLYAYGENRKAAQPCRITLSGMGPVMDTGVRRLKGFDKWLGVNTDSRCYTEMFEKDELVYLTADSPDTVTHLEKGKVYVIGGLVDRNAHKGLCFKKATAQGIATAKLPLKNEDLHGSHSKVLATNHVFGILLRAMGAGGELGKVEEKALPPRKRAGWAGGGDRAPSTVPVAQTADQENVKQVDSEEHYPNHNTLKEIQGEAVGVSEVNLKNEEDNVPSLTPTTMKGSRDEESAATTQGGIVPTAKTGTEAAGKADTGCATERNNESEGFSQNTKGKRVAMEENDGTGSSAGADSKRSRSTMGGDDV